MVPDVWTLEPDARAEQFEQGGREPTFVEAMARGPSAEFHTVRVTLRACGTRKDGTQLEHEALPGTDGDALGRL